MVWEYCNGLANYAQMNDLLRELGEQGWELVQVLPAPHYMEVDRRTHYDRLQYYMKRPVPVRPSNAQDRTEPALHVLAR